MMATRTTTHTSIGNGATTDVDRVALFRKGEKMMMVAAAAAVVALMMVITPLAVFTVLSCPTRRPGRRPARCRKLDRRIRVARRVPGTLAAQPPPAVLEGLAPRRAHPCRIQAVPAPLEALVVPAFLEVHVLSPPCLLCLLGRPWAQCCR